MFYARVVEHTENIFEKADSDFIHDTIQHASNNTDRSKQQQDFRLGASNIGHCRQHAVYLIRQEEPTDVRDKSAAFYGTVAGDAIEQHIAKIDKRWIIQPEGFSKFLSGGGVGTHADLVMPWKNSVTVEQFEARQKERAEAFQRIADGEADVEVPEQVFVQGVRDLKSKDKLDYVKLYGPTQQQIFQLHQYVNACIEDGLLNGDEPIWISDIYFDRSGSQHQPYTFGMWYDPAVLEEIDAWVQDVILAVAHNEDASKDKAREWCWSYCEYATKCRGNDTDAEGLIEDPEILALVNTYAEANAMESAAAKLKKQTKEQIPANLSGTTGTHTVRWVEVGPSEMKAYTRAGYMKLDIRPIPGPKKPKGKK